jgi:RimJ/RimL family protein N-acetyltransferase
MSAQTHNNEHEETNTLTLPDGYDIPFRHIQPDDVPALYRFHSRLSEDTVYLRFFGPLDELSEEKAQYFAHTDGVDHVGLVALDPDDPDEMIAIVRYDREPDSDYAEYAAIVEDRWQEHKLGACLTQELIGEALDKGVKHFYGLAMARNQRMLKLLRGLGLPEQERQEEEARFFEVELQPVEA